MSRTLGAAQFKEQCLAILDQVDPGGIVITKHGRPVAKLIPIERTSEHLIGCLRGKIRVVGDIMSTGVKWDAVELAAYGDRRRRRRSLAAAWTPA